MPVQTNRRTPRRFILLPGQLIGGSFEVRMLRIGGVLGMILGMFFAPKIFTLAILALSGWLVWRATVEIFPLLLLFYLAPRDFLGGVDSLSGGIGESDANLQGLKVWVILVACLRLIWEGMQRGQPFFFRGGTKWWFGIWLLVIPAALLSSYWGYRSGYENWTRSARFLATAGMFFYGVLVARRSVQEVPLLSPFIQGITFALIVMASLGMYSQHLLFLLIGFAAAFGVGGLLSGRLPAILVGSVLLAAAGWLAINGTFTMRGIFTLSSSLALVGIGRRMTFPIGVVATGALLVVPCILTIAILFGGTKVSTGPLQNEFTTSLAEKVTGDRGSLWVEAFDQITGGPYLLAPSGRPLLLLNRAQSEETEWSVGAHNALLESVRNGGVIVGGICVTFVFWQLFQMKQAIQRVRLTRAAPVAIAVFSTAVVGVATGDFPLDHNVGFWLWSLTGVCVEFGNAVSGQPSLVQDS